MKTQKVGVMLVFKDKELVALIHKDEVSHKNIFYSCKEMDMESLEELLGADKVVPGSVYEDDYKTLKEKYKPLK